MSKGVLLRAPNATEWKEQYHPLHGPVVRRLHDAEMHVTEPMPHLSDYPAYCGSRSERKAKNERVRWRSSTKDRINEVQWPLGIGFNMGRTPTILLTAENIFKN